MSSTHQCTNEATPGASGGGGTRAAARRRRSAGAASARGGSARRTPARPRGCAREGREAGLAVVGGRVRREPGRGAAAAVVRELRHERRGVARVEAGRRGDAQAREVRLVLVVAAVAREEQVRRALERLRAREREEPARVEEGQDGELDAARRRAPVDLLLRVPVEQVGELVAEAEAELVGRRPQDVEQPLGHEDGPRADAGDEGVDHGRPLLGRRKQHDLPGAGDAGQRRLGVRARAAPGVRAVEPRRAERARGLEAAPHDGLDLPLLPLQLGAARAPLAADVDARRARAPRDGLEELRLLGRRVVGVLDDAQLAAGAEEGAADGDDARRAHGAPHPPLLKGELGEAVRRRDDAREGRGLAGDRSAQHRAAHGYVAWSRAVAHAWEAPQRAGCDHFCQELVAN